MFRYSLFLDTLLKAMTHKYIRRVPKGVTRTGKTKYMYFYAGQEGHGRGIAHEEEIVEGASFAFGEHGKTRYHAHISKVDGDKVTVKYDDGAKKGTEETMTKKQFQSMIHGEHSTSIQSAKEKATKQLKDFQAGKEKGGKVKQETLDKLEQRVNNLDQLTAKKEDTAINKIKSMLKTELNDKRKIRLEDGGGSVGMEGFLSVAKDIMRTIKNAHPSIDLDTNMLEDIIEPDIFDDIMEIDMAFTNLETSNRSTIKEKSVDIQRKYGQVGKAHLQSGIYADIYKKAVTPSFRGRILKDILDNVSQATLKKNFDIHLWKQLQAELQKTFDNEISKLHQE